MKRIYISTIHRGEPTKESTKVYCINLESGEVLRRRKLPSPMQEMANPRGGHRGCRGLAFRGSHLYASGYDVIFRLDPEDLFVHEAQWFRSCGDIHQITIEGDRLVIANTRDTRIDVLNFKDRTLSGLEDYSFCSPSHLNSFSQKYVLLSSVGMVIDRQTQEVVFQDELLKGAHDLCHIGDHEVAINLSVHKRTVVLNTSSWSIDRLLYVDFETPSVSTDISKTSWLRGLHYLSHNDQLLIGSSPAKVILLSNVSSSPYLEKAIQISCSTNEAVFAVVPHPGDWQ